MSLLIHLPLINDLSNLGLLNSNPSGGTYVLSGGKIGKGYYSGNITIPFIHTSKGDFSIAFWWLLDLNSESFNLGVPHTVNNGSITSSLLSVPGYLSTGNPAHIAIKYTGDNNTLMLWVRDNRSTTITALNSGWTAGKWNHLVFTTKNLGSNVTVAAYVNGLLYESNTKEGYNIKLDSGQVTFSGNCYKNDLRIYDHCLSEKEIKELSKGLILHYPLNEHNFSGITNYYSGNTILGRASSHAGCITLTNYDSYTNYKLSYTGTGTNYWANITFPYVENFPQDIEIIYDIYLRVNSRSNTNIYMRGGLVSNDNSTSRPLLTIPTNNLWVHYTVRRLMTLKVTTGGNEYNSRPLILFYTDNMVTKDKIYTFNMDIANVSIALCKVSDCSGYCNNGTVNGNLTTSTNTPRYDKCSVFTDDNTLWIRTRHFDFLKQFTFSAWCSLSNRTCTTNDAANTSLSIISLGRDYNAYGFNLNLINGVPNVSYGKVGTNASISSTSAIALNTWHHIVGTYDGTTVKLYVDGELSKSATASNVVEWTDTSESFVVGKMAYSYTNTKAYRNFVGSISDVRVYATALSADDIKELYNSSASLDKNGNLLTYQLIES